MKTPEPQRKNVLAFPVAGGEPTLMATAISAAPGLDGPVSHSISSLTTIVIACLSCGAPLRVGSETPRNAACGYCGTMQYLPDPLWLLLHPAKKRVWWFIRLGQ